MKIKATTPLFTPSRIAMFIAVSFATVISHEILAVSKFVTTAEPIMGTAPQVESTNFTVKTVINASTYKPEDVILVESTQSPRDIEFSGVLSNAVVSDVDSDPNPTATVADLEKNAVIYKWFDGLTEITNAQALADFSTYAGKRLTLQVAVPVKATTDAGYPRTNITEDGITSQFFTHTFQVQIGNAPQIVANGAKFKLNEGFPKTGFKGAEFAIQTPIEASNYSWESSEPTLASVSSDGIVKLESMPANATTPIKITATPNSPLALGASFNKLEYTFTLERWFIHGGDYNREWPNIAYYCQREPERNYAIPLFEQHLSSGTERSANGRLWNEWGDLNYYANASPRWAGQSSSDFYWAAEVGNTVATRNQYQRTSLTPGGTAPSSSYIDNKATAYQVCVRNLDGSAAYPIPRINDLQVEGIFGENTNWTVSYRYDADGGARDRSTYSSLFEDTIAGSLSVYDSTTEFNGTFNAETGRTSQVFPITASQAGKTFIFAVRAINDDNIPGSVGVVANDKLPEEGNKLTTRFYSISTPLAAANFPIKPLGDAENFPQTGFLNAKFRINVGDDTGSGNSNYTWRAELASGGTTDLVAVNEFGPDFGEVTLVKEPTKATPIAIIATPKPGIPGGELRYEFEVKKWFYPDLPMPTLSITKFANVNTVQNPSATPFSIDAGFPKTGFKNAQFVLNILGWNDININSTYTWESSDPALATVTNAGIVTLVAKPDSAKEITITARPPAGSTNPPLTYKFKVETWFDPDRPMPAKPAATAFSNITTPLAPSAQPFGLDEGFPTTGFKDAKFKLNIADAWDATKTINDQYTWTAELAAGGETDLVTVNAAGEVTLAKEPAKATPIAIIATPKAGVPGSPLRYQFEVKKWFYPDLPMPTLSITKFANVNTVQNPSATPFSIDAGFPKTGFKNAQFVLNILGWNDININSTYTWQSSDPALATVTNAGIVTLIAKPDSAKEITITATPPAGSTNPPLTYKFKVETWFDPDMPMPVKPAATAFSNITTPLAPSAQPFGLDEGFPTTGFKDAKFKLNIADPWDATKTINDQYTWTAELAAGGATDLVTVNTAGEVTLAKEPAKATPIAIIATPKAGVPGSPLRYQFEVKKWFYPDLPMPTLSITKFANVNTVQNPSATPFSIDAGFPKTGFKNAQFVLNILGWNDININSTYTWQSSDPALATVTNAGIVTLVAKPASAKEITITATPPAGSTNPPLTYKFKVETWFDPDMPMPAKPAPTAFSNITTPIVPSAQPFSITAGFPKTGFANAKFKLNINDVWDNQLNINDQYNWSSSVSSASVDATGTVTLLSKPSSPEQVRITARPKSGTGAALYYIFKLEKWFFEPTITTPPKPIMFTDITTPDVPATFTLTDGFPTTGFAGARFQINVTDNRVSDFTWSSTHSSVTVSNTGMVTLVSDPGSPTLVAITGIPKNGVIAEVQQYSFTLKEWFNPNL